jgi:hypothetical protein
LDISNMTDNCKSCRFFKRPPLITNDEGKCGRFPPQVQFIASPKGIMEMSAFPSTKQSNWCGEHQSPAISVIPLPPNLTESEKAALGGAYAP